MSIIEPTRQAWLADRRTLIGASESPSILGRGYRTAAQVWADKLGVDTGDDTADEPVKFAIGNIIQPALIEIAREVLGVPALAEPANVVRRSEIVPYVGASLDATCGVDENGRDVPFEAKNVDSFNASQWKDGAPVPFVIQVQHQLFVTGASYGYAFGLIGGNRPVLHRIERNEQFIQALLWKLKQFWGYVESRTPPPYQDPADQARVLATLYPKASGSAIELDEVAQQIKDRRDAIGVAATELEAKLAECDNELKAMLGDNSFASLPDGSWVSWKEIAGSTYTVTRKPYRRLLFHDKRPKDAPALTSDPVESIAIEFQEELPRGDEFFDRFIEAESAVLQIGGVVRHRSPTGSVYYVLPGGLNVRISDHDPTPKTREWLERYPSMSVLLYSDDWKRQLEAIVGTMPNHNPVTGD